MKGIPLFMPKKPTTVPITIIIIKVRKYLTLTRWEMEMKKISTLKMHMEQEGTENLYTLVFLFGKHVL